MILKDQITTIFVQIDDFCKEFDLQIKNLKLNAAGDNKKRRNRSCLMSDSEIITIKKLFADIGKICSRKAFLTTGLWNCSKEVLWSLHYF